MDKWNQKEIKYLQLKEKVLFLIQKSIAQKEIEKKMLMDLLKSSHIKNGEQL